VGGIEVGVGIIGEFFVFLLNVLVIALMGCLFGSRGGWSVEGVASVGNAVNVVGKG
jgi:hypothetical protein